SNIRVGLDATVTAVKTSNLDEFRIVYFATHGLVAGDLGKFAEGKVEPSLALSIPDKPTDFDDGLLFASEVAQLKLNADWVVLSVCKTAAEEKPGAEALSGLARAFFYAGARSLIVSHWQVDDQATAKLMIKCFCSYQSILPCLMGKRYSRQCWRSSIALPRKTTCIPAYGPHLWSLGSPQNRRATD